MELGGSLAAYAVRYVVVAESLAPTVLGYRSTVPAEVPQGVVESLDRQIDLKAVSTESGYVVFDVPGWVPERAVSTTGDGVLVGADPRSWHPVLRGSRAADAFRGTIPAGILRLAVSPPSQWEVSGRGVARLRRSTASEAPSVEFTVPRAEPVSVAFDGSWWHKDAVVGAIVLWVLALAALFGWHRRLGRVLLRGRQDAPAVEPVRPGGPPDDRAPSTVVAPEPERQTVLPS